MRFEFFQSQITVPEAPEHLSIQAFAAIGMMNMLVPEQVIFRELVLEEWMEEPALGLIIALQVSRHRLIRRWVDVGLPAGACTPLPGLVMEDAEALRDGELSQHRVFCGLCRCWVNYVPCPHCNIKQSTRRPLRPRMRFPLGPARSPADVTGARPGTVGKRDVLRTRWAAGEPLFAGGDTQLTDDFSELKQAGKPNEP